MAADLSNLSTQQLVALKAALAAQSAQPGQISQKPQTAAGRQGIEMPPPAAGGDLSKMSTEDLLQLRARLAGTQEAATGEGKPRSYAWSEVPMAALQNLPADASAIASGLYEAVTDPVGTARTLYDVGTGALRHGVEKLPEPVSRVLQAGADPETIERQKAMAGALGESLKESYTTEEGFKRQLAEHPLTSAMDLSIVAGGAEGLLARVPGMAKAAQAVGGVGRALNPINIVAEPVKAATTRYVTGRQIAQASKTKGELQKTKNELYELADNTVGKIQADAKEVADMVRNMAGEGRAKGFGGPLAKTVETQYPRSRAVLQDMYNLVTGMAKGNTPPPTYGDIERMRQTLNDVVKDSKNAQGQMSADGYLASRMIEHIDDMVERTPYQEARESYRRLRKTERVERAIADAEERSSSLDLAYKNEFKKILREEKRKPMFTPSEIAEIRKVAGHGSISNLLEGLGRAGFSSKSVTGPAAVSTAAAGAAYLAGIDPMTAAAITSAATTGAKVAGTRMTKAAAERARNLVSQGDKALDARLARARRGISTTARSGTNILTAAQSARQKMGWKPLRLKDGSTFWNPEPAEYERLIREEGAVPIQ